MRCSNLPSQLSTFIGREREIATVTRLLGATRLLTLAGPGGCGKTRLALAVAEGLQRRYPDGVWFVELASISDPNLAPQAIAMALGFRALPGRPLIDALIAQFRSQRVLLLLDNCEHLLAACADLAFALMTAAPGLRILATSREPLRITGETLYSVPPLTTPKLDALPPPQQLARVEAVRLFVERASKANTEFALTEQNALPVSRICCWLAGSPLAIELAAARTRAFSPAQIADRLGDALSFLTTGNRSAPARHRTLQATLDWSYKLLAPAEQTLFRRLSVFADSFSLEGAEAIWEPDPRGESGRTAIADEADPAMTRAALALLAGLLDKSLLEVESETGPDRRFRYLEPVRQYALEKLAASGEEPEARDRLLRWAVAFAEHVGPDAYTSRARQCIEQLEVEHANLRAALAWSMREPRNAVWRHRLANALPQFWQNRGYVGEGMRWFEQLLSSDDDAPIRLRIDACYKAAFLAIHAREYAKARRYLEQGIGIAEGLNDRYGMAQLYHHLCFLTFTEGDLAGARRLSDLTLRMFEAEGDDWGRAIVLFYQANIDHMELDYRSAQAAYRKSLEICRSIDYLPALARRLIRLGQVCRLLGETDEAAASIAEGLRISREMGDNWGIAMGFAAMAGLARAAGHDKRAAWLLGVTQHLLERFGVPLWKVDAIEYDRNRAELRSMLGEDAFADASARGADEAARDLQAALQNALEQPSQGQTPGATAARPAARPVTASAVSSPLSRREQEVAALVAQGKTNIEIAAILFVGLRTVEAHVTHILNKLGFNSRAQIAAWVAAQSAPASSEATR